MAATIACWYGWIPILTTELLATDRSNFIRKIFPRPISDTDKNEKITGEPEYSPNGFLSKLKLDMNEFGRELEVPCEITSNGLVKFWLPHLNANNSLQEDQLNNVSFPIVIFDIIRDYYHQHVHHSRYDDCKLSPVKCTQTETAIHEIFHQYRNKILYYHRTLHHYESKKTFRNWWKKLIGLKRQLKQVQTGLGEYSFAKSFMGIFEQQLISQNIDIPKMGKAFDEAIQSLTVLKDKSSWRLMWLVSVVALSFIVVQIVFSILFFYISA